MRQPLSAARCRCCDRGLPTVPGHNGRYRRVAGADFEDAGGGSASRLGAVANEWSYGGSAAGARTTIGTAGKNPAISERDLRSAAVP
jgi:hypothetical protein